MWSFRNVCILSGSYVILYSWNLIRWLELNVPFCQIKCLCLWWWLRRIRCCKRSLPPLNCLKISIKWLLQYYCINTSGSYYTELGPLTVKLSHFTQQIKFDKAARRISSDPSIMFGCIRTIISLYCYYNAEFYHSSKIIEQLSVECIKLTDLRNLKKC